MDAVRRYDILDTPPDGAYDRVAALAAHLFDVPVAAVTIVDTDRIWFKAAHGLEDVSEIGRDPGLCAAAVLSMTPPSSPTPSPIPVRCHLLRLLRPQRRPPPREERKWPSPRPPPDADG